jgi:hypothetical protein
MSFKDVLSLSKCQYKKNSGGRCSEAGLLNKGSCLARTLGVTKFMNMRNMILVTLVVLLKVRLTYSTNPPLSPWMVQQQMDTILFPVFLTKDLTDAVMRVVVHINDP